MTNRPTKVIVHCADTPDFSPDDPKFDLFGLEQIRQWHLKRGWADVGYHYIIRRTGVLEVGRAEDIQGSHCKEQNKDSLGVCLVGKGKFTDAQKDTLVRLFIDLGARYRIALKDWFGHYQFNKLRTCPNVKIEEVKKWLCDPIF